MPSGKIRYWDAERGFGFITQDDGGEDVHVRLSALPDGVTSLRRGQKVDFGIADGKKGLQALSVKLLEAPPSLSKASRKSPEQMVLITEDLIKMLDGLGNSYRRGHFPDSKIGRKVSVVLRAVADELEL